jgi:hypothetical protein
MNRILQKRMWLAGASLLAIALGLGEANADGFSFQEIIPLTGYYEFRVAGADGGGNGFEPGGAGAVVGGELFLDAGDTLSAVVGGGGGSGGTHITTYGGGGGGGSFVFLGSSYRGGGLLFAAAGGSGAAFFSAGGGPPGIGYGGHPAGPASYGGFAGGGAFGPPFSGPQQPAQPGSFPNGGAGACCYFGGGPSGGYGGGGGGGYDTGGGGGGAAGVRGYGGGYSYVINTARNAWDYGGQRWRLPRRLRAGRLCVHQLCGVGPRAIDLGDDAHGLRWTRLARSPAQAQTHADLTALWRPAAIGSATFLAKLRPCTTALRSYVGFGRGERAASRRKPLCVAQKRADLR